VRKGAARPKPRHPLAPMTQVKSSGHRVSASSDLDCCNVLVRQTAYTSIPIGPPTSHQP
jgi:hypothetical protein